MDFDSAMQKDKALWKAYAPSKIKEKDGDIIVTIPYQKQLHQEDMAPDTSAPQQSFDLIIRAYEPNIIRLSTDRSKVEVYLIPTNEEYMIASDTEAIVRAL